MEHTLAMHAGSHPAPTLLVGAIRMYVRSPSLSAQLAETAYSVAARTCAQDWAPCAVRVAVQHAEQQGAVRVEAAVLASNTVRVLVQSTASCTKDGSRCRVHLACVQPCTLLACVMAAHHPMRQYRRSWGEQTASTLR